MNEVWIGIVDSRPFHRSWVNSIYIFFFWNGEPQTYLLINSVSKNKMHSALGFQGFGAIKTLGCFVTIYIHSIRQRKSQKSSWPPVRGRKEKNWIGYKGKNKSSISRLMHVYMCMGKEQGCSTYLVINQIFVWLINQTFVWLIPSSFLMYRNSEGNQNSRKPQISVYL